MILTGYGYVLPRTLFTEEEFETLRSHISDGDNNDELDLVEQGCYGTMDDTQIYIGFIDDTALVTNVKVSSSENIAIGCEEFAVVRDLDDNTDDYYERRQKRLVEKKKELDTVLCTLVPTVFLKIPSERYNDWVFAYYQ